MDPIKTDEAAARFLKAFREVVRVGAQQQALAEKLLDRLVNEAREG